MNPLKQILKEQKITQKKASEILGITQAAVSLATINEVQGTIEKTIIIAESLDLESHSFDKNGYKIVLSKLL